MRTISAAIPSSMTARSAAGPRYVVGLCPEPNAAAGVAATEWLGRMQHGFTPRPFVPGFSAALFCALTEEPCRDGFRASLAGPFHAARDVSVDAIATQLRLIAREQPAFHLPALRARLAGGRLCLAPEEHTREASLLSARCVVQLDALRAPPTSEEVRERIMQGLTVRQHSLLLRWGDPFVMEEFRLRFPLTGQLTMFDEEVAERLAAQAEVHFRDVMESLRRIDQIALFEQDAPGAPFRIVRALRLRPA